MSATAWRATKSWQIIAGILSLPAPTALIHPHYLELLMAKRVLLGMQRHVVSMSLKRSRTTGTSYSQKGIKPMSVFRQMMEARFYHIHAFLYVQVSDSFFLQWIHISKT
jgi:hypothetical protein